MSATRYESHPYALLLPPLTGDEYAALKSDIAAHGVLYPVILDEDGRVLDGVHREKIAAELGIELPTATHTGLSDERKLHLAVGLNMRRRHLDADRRRALVRKLHTDEGLSLRKIASITGWSKSTIDRDLKTSPFEQAAETARKVAADAASIGNDAASAVLTSLGDAVGWLFGWADERWKRGTWPPADDDRMLMLLYIADTQWVLRQLEAAAEGRELPPRPIPAPHPTWAQWWGSVTADRQQEIIGRVKSGRSDALLAAWDRLGVPDGTPR
jgi:hypothetical protein